MNEPIAPIGGQMKKRGHFSTARVLLATASLSTLAVIVVPNVSHAGATTPSNFYLSLGDSYAVGFQPQPSPGGATSGYTAVVAKKLKMTLVNFGCGGATT